MATSQDAVLADRKPPSWHLRAPYDRPMAVSPGVAASGGCDAAAAAAAPHQQRCLLRSQRRTGPLAGDVMEDGLGPLLTVADGELRQVRRLHVLPAEHRPGRLS